MKPHITFIFSGQGSQYYQMGRELYQQVPPFKAHFDWLDHHLQAVAGFSMVDVLYAADRTVFDRFDQLQYTHPALFMIQYALARTLIEQGVKPDRVLGISLGESVALCIAGVLPAAQVLSALVRQTHFIEADCPAGGLLAVLRGADFFASQPALFQHCELAAVSTPQLICVAATTAALDRTEALLKRQSIACERLPLQQPFHSSHLDRIQAQFMRLFTGVTFQRPTLEVVSAMQAGPVTSVDAEFMWRVKRQPIYFHQTLQQLPAQPEGVFVDLGPTGTLANFIKYSATAVASSRVYSLLSPTGPVLENYRQCLGDLAAHTLVSANRDALLI
jgi:acyl transferase domain-containing protein